MKKKLISLFISLLVVSSLCFPSIALAAPKELKKTQDFAATLTLWQIQSNPEQMGNSERFRSTGELFTGLINNSTWTDINSDLVIPNFTMSSFTNFERTSSLDIFGTIHGTAQITANNGDILYLVTNGQIQGNMITGAVVTMNWTSTGGTGIFAGIHASGKLNGNFSWLPFFQDPQLPPSGVMELSGKYK